MALQKLPDMERLTRLTAELETPCAVIDEPTLWSNADELVRRAAGAPIRVASKSVRVRAIIERTLARPGFAGVMAYSLAEANWLADSGVDDVLLAYPTVDRGALRDLAADEHRAGAVTVMIDCFEQLDLIEAAVGPAVLRTTAHPVRICIDVDASLRVGPFHLGVRRSPLRTPGQVTRLAQQVTARRGFTLVGLMFYDAQVAGLPDSSAAVRLVKRRSVAELATRRRAIVDAVSDLAALSIVNGGGTGSLEDVSTDPALTEVTAGSGLFMPTLFDGYDAFSSSPAAFFALSVVRKPRRNIATLYSGGYIASGVPGEARVPTPTWPPGLSLLGTEAAGEVQTPVKGRPARRLTVGDRVWMRHAKAGEQCERFDSVALVGDDAVEILPTYRGEGRNFG